MQHRSMGTQPPYLNDMFARARREPPVVSEDEIDALLDQVDLHGRQGNEREMGEHLQRTVLTRNIIMGSIAAILIGGFIGAGALFWNPGKGTIPQSQTTANVLQQPLMQSLVSPIPPIVAQTPATTEAQKGSADQTTASLPPAQPVAVNHQSRAEQPLLGKEVDGGEDVDIDQKIFEELQELIQNYWINKINEYKRYIDNNLKSADRNTLDKLRVKWGTLEDDMMSGMNFSMNMGMQLGADNKPNVKFGGSLSNSDGKPEMKALDNLTNTDGVEVKDLGDGKFAVNVNQDEVASSVNGDGATAKRVVIITNDNKIEVNSNGQDLNVNADVDMDVETDISIPKDGMVSKDNEQRKVVQRNIVIRRDNGVEQRTESNVVLEDFNDIEDGIETPLKDIETSLDGMNPQFLTSMLKMAIQSDESESSKIIVQTWGIAERNRDELDGLKGMIEKDLNTFISLMQEKLSEIVDEDGDKLSEAMRDALSEKADNTGGIFESEGIGKNIIDPFYNILIEPMILLYNGSDISDLLSSTIAEPVAGVSLNANSTLKQSYPNPATNEATIDFSLQETSPATTLRLFDAQGSEVRHMDLGSLRGGDHSAQLNVSDLAPGTYLYHLTVQTSSGEQVFSKKMQVVR